MRVLALVQARMGSTRLPGKSLQRVWRDTTLLELVLRRVRAASKLDEVVLATTDSGADDPLLELAARLSIAAFRGSEDDVLDRFAAALAAHPADAVVRVCGDNPFVDPSAIDALIEDFAAGAVDYATNAGEASGLPDGSGVEIASAEALRRAAAEASEIADREHVTPFLRRGGFAVRELPPPRPRWPRLKLDIDDPADLERMRRVAAELPEEGAPLWPLEAIVRAYETAAGHQSPDGSPSP